MEEKKERKVGIDDVPQKCLVCGYDCKNRRSLGNHVARSHKDIGGLKNYVLRFYLDNIVPICACGCGNDVAWKKTAFTFGTYVNGHNPAGFKLKQPTFTQEQIDKRNEAIRAAYTERGTEIKAKISGQVKKGLETSGIDFSSYFVSKWKDENFRSKNITSQRNAWKGSVGEERRKRVFTPEFGKKISRANMHRDVKQTSKEEERFCDALESNGFKIERSKWFNFSDKTWNVDAFMAKESCLLEFDGTYWHGFDREKNWSLAQLASISNDLQKNLIARHKKLNLMRFKEGTDISSATTLDGLERAAYHVVHKGRVTKEGTFRLHELQPIFEREFMIRRHLDGKRQETIDEYIPALLTFLRAYVGYWGWFYPCIDFDINDVFSKVREGSTLSDDGVIKSNNVGSSELKAMFRSFWSTQGGPKESFHVDRILKKVVDYRMGINNSKDYTYRLSDGEQVTLNEHFDVCLHTIRRGFLVQRRAVSWFKPTVAGTIWRHLLGDSNVAPIVWDPSAGFGARALGFHSSYMKGTYITNEPASMTRNDLENMYDACDAVLEQRLSRQIFPFGSERELNVDDASIDAVFTSPPYFDKEQYFDEPEQCWKRFSDLQAWIEGYLVPTFANVKRVLKPEGRAAINVSSNLSDIVIDAMRLNDMRLVETLKLPLRSDHFLRKRNITSARFEPIQVFAHC